MRTVLSAIFVALIAVLGLCAFLSFRSKKPIGRSLGIFIASLTFPVMGNLFVISSPVKELATSGYYIYFLGMDVMMICLIIFMFDYCHFTFHPRLVKTIIYFILALDSIQLLLNLQFSHAFTVGFIDVPGFGVYLKFFPTWGQTIHRVVDYSILGGVMIAFMVKTIVTPRIYMEKYLVILLAMIAVAAWQTFYIFSGTPVDYSMTGFAVFGVLVFLLSLYYRPLRLMDRMLGTIASRMPEALFFFDKNGRCIWINKKGAAFLGIEETAFDETTEGLKNKLGDDYEREGDEWRYVFTRGTGDSIVSYVLEKHPVIDDKNRVVGSYLSIRDNTSEQKTIQKEKFNAEHDALTKVYNRAGFDFLMEKVDLSTVFLVLVDGDNFKEVNDKFGHTVGDKALIRITDSLLSHFRDEDYVCRIGGDEFAVIMPNVDGRMIDTVGERINNINRELTKLARDLPPLSISAGGAYGKDAENAYELFNNADHALYETKFKGKHGFTIFKTR